MLPEIAQWVDRFAIDDNIIVFEEGRIDNSLGHWHVNIHGCLHGHFLLKLDVIVVVNSLALFFLLSSLLLSNVCPTFCSFEEWYCEGCQILFGRQGSSTNDLSSIVAIVICVRVVGDKWSLELPRLRFFPIYSLEDWVLLYLGKRRSEARITDKDGLE